MFFGYPIAATSENWLHDCLRKMVNTIHARFDAGGNPPPWPDIIPTQRREALRSRTGLRDRLIRYASAASKLTSLERAKVSTCLAQQNDIAKLVRCTSNCDRLSDLPKPVREPAKDLFQFAFTLLTDLGIRDRHYLAIYGLITDKVCPFCGSEYFDAPGGPREDLDHYLASSHYAFAAANLRNLSPMGSKCNARYKSATDILRDQHGRRRRAFDPYANRVVKLSLLNSVPFGGTDGRTPAWQLDFVPDTAECETWDDVFCLRERLQRDVLDQSFPRWLGEFAAWHVRRKGIADLRDRCLIDSVREHAEDMAAQGFKAREFLRSYVFEMIHQQCAQGNRRLLDFVRDVITKAVPAGNP